MNSLARLPSAGHFCIDAMATTTAARNIRFAYSKLGPLLRRDAVDVLESTRSDPSRKVGEVWIEEDINYAQLYTAVPYFPKSQIDEQLTRNWSAWRDIVEIAYQQRHTSETVVFQDNSISRESVCR